MGLGEIRLGEMGLGEMGQNPSNILQTKITTKQVSLQVTTLHVMWFNTQQRAHIYSRIYGVKVNSYSVFKHTGGITLYPPWRPFSSVDALSVWLHSSIKHKTQRFADKPLSAEHLHATTRDHFLHTIPLTTFYTVIRTFSETSDGLYTLSV